MPIKRPKNSILRDLHAKTCTAYNLITEKKQDQERLELSKNFCDIVDKIFYIDNQLISKKIKVHTTTRARAPILDKLV